MYIVLLFKKKNTTQREAYSRTAEPGSLGHQPCSSCEVNSSGGDGHPVLNTGEEAYAFPRSRRGVMSLTEGDVPLPPFMRRS